MAQHFLLSAKMRNLSLAQIALLSDVDILSLLKTARWQNADNINDVICPRCNVRHQAYFLNARQQWQCKYCQYRFSITANTIFHQAKLSLRQILMAVYLFAIKSKGISAIALSHALNVQYRTAWVLLHKFREALNQTKDLSKMQGEVHIDGCYVNGYIRPKNALHKRIDRRAKKHQRKDKACVLIFRQKAANQDVIQGADRTIVALVKNENSRDVLEISQRLIKPLTKICTDFDESYTCLNYQYNLSQVNHKIEYRSIEGITNNLAESGFARFRRMMKGVHHRMHNNYMLLYANETAWREDNRRKSLKEKFNDVLTRCLCCRPSRDLMGYWQGNKKPPAQFGWASIAPNDDTYLTAA
ncbi:IS1595 family transposase [Ursidibacter sp. B-7004-1]